MPTYAPFDKVIITAAAPFVPPKLIEQLKPGGKMIIPVDEGEHQRMLRLTKNEDGSWTLKDYRTIDDKVIIETIASDLLLSDIYADVFFKSNVNCNGLIKLNGKRSSVIGGAMSAVEGITCFNVGNEFGVKTEMYAGVSADRAQALDVQKKKVEVLEKHLKSIAEGLMKFDDIIQKSGNEKAKSDPRRIQLLRAKIQEEATCTDEKVRLTDMENTLRRGSHATIKIKRKIFSGVILGIGQQKLAIKELHERVSYSEGTEEIRMDVLSQEELND